MSSIDERLRGLDIVLPDVMPPVVNGYVPAFAPVVRSGDQIHLSGRLGKKDGKPLCWKVGEVVSGTQSPTLGMGIGMGYVPPDVGKAGTAIEIEIRGKRSAAVVVPKPFYRASS